MNSSAASQKCVVKFLKKSLCFISTTFAASLLGIIFVAIILNFFYWVKPDYYKWLTYWANQKGVPTLSACKFKKLPTPNFEPMKQYSWYEVEVFLTNKKDVASALVYSTTEDMAVQINKGKVNLTTTKDVPYVIFWKLKLKKTMPLIRLQVKNKYRIFEENITYPYFECPIKVEFFIDE